MGRTHKLPIFSSKYIKDFHPKSGWCTSKIYALLDIEIDDEDIEYYEYIVSLFFNYYFEKTFMKKIYDELILYYDPNSDLEFNYDKNKGSNVHIQNIITIILDYMKEVLKKNKNKKWVVNGLFHTETIYLYNFNIENFEMALSNHFQNFNVHRYGMWLEHYTLNYSNIIE